MTDNIETRSIARTPSVYYGTYATFPLAARTDDLAYASDLRCLYYWNGAAWVVLTVYSLAGLYADIPAAATLPNGSIYYATDMGIFYIKQGAAWLPVASTTVSTSGTYVGNDTANRAIPHGLGKIPAIYFIVEDGAYLFVELVSLNQIEGISAAAGAQYTYPQTAPTTTNFYVGNAASYNRSANNTGHTYYWVALA